MACYVHSIPHAQVRQTRLHDVRHHCATRFCSGAVTFVDVRRHQQHGSQANSSGDSATAEVRPCCFAARAVPRRGIHGHGVTPPCTGTDIGPTQWVDPERAIVAGCRGPYVRDHGRTHVPMRSRYCCVCVDPALPTTQASLAGPHLMARRRSCTPALPAADQMERPSASLAPPLAEWASRSAYFDKAEPA